MELSCGIFTGGEILKNIEIEGLKGKHREVLGEKSNQKNGTILITKFLAGVIKDVEGYEFNSDPVKALKQKETLLKRMVVGDRDLIVVELKKISKNPTLECSSYCTNPMCNELNEEIIELSDIVVNKISDPKVIDGNPVITYEHEGKKYTSRIPLGEDAERIDNLGKQNPYKAGQQMFQNCLVSIDNDTNIPYNLIREMDVDELDEIVYKWQSLLPGPQLTRDVKCFSCGRSFQSPMDFSDFLSGGGFRKK